MGNVVTLNAGDLVQRQHMWDGSPRAGKPIGPVLTVVDVHTIYPTEMRIPTVVVDLSDDGWAFPINLHVVDERTGI